MEKGLHAEIHHLLGQMAARPEDELYSGLKQTLMKHAVSGIFDDADGDHWQEFQELAAAIESTILLAKVDRQGNILKLNDNFLVLTGYTRPELIGQSISMFSAGLHPEAFLGEIWEKINHGTIWRGEVKKRTKQSGVLWMNATIVPIVGEQGEIQHFLSLYIDISRRKKAEGDLEMYLQMVNLSNDAIEVANRSGRLVYVNERAAQNLGYPREELLGKYLWELQSAFHHEDDWVAFWNMIQEKEHGVLQESISKRKDGTTFPTEVNARFLELGSEGFVIAVIRDISDRRVSDYLMQKTQHILSEAQLLAKIASFEVDLEKGSILHSENAWEVLGFANSQQFNMDNLVKQIHDEDLPKMRKAWLDASTRGESIRIEFRVMSAQGEVQHILGLAQTLMKEDGKQGTLLCTAQNITRTVASRIELEQRTWELEKRNEELDQFAQIVSHDLKSPLRAIHNLAEWIKESRGRDEAEMDAHIELLQRRIQRMENLINGILTYSSAGRSKDRISLFSSHEVFNDICESQRMSGIPVKIVMDTMPELREDRVVFEQVMSNLVSNAIKHNDKEEAQVTITHGRKANFHEFTIEDNGPGIDPRYHKKVFHIFQTIQTRDKTENTGVGLAIVKKLCDEKGWNIILKNRQEEGVRFTIQIPV